MVFSWFNLQKPLIICPPMDGITDCAFREMIADYAGSDVLYTEFVNVKSIIHGNPKAFKDLEYTDKQRPIIVQLFGSDPNDFYLASKEVIKLGFDAIDINMGCPAIKVVQKGGGCALMNDTPKSIKILLETIRGANEESKKLNKKIEVSVKMRLGVKNKETVFSHGLELIKAGARSIAIHGRTLEQMYSGCADWTYIKKFVKLAKEEFKNTIDKPIIIGSGDVKNLFEAFIKIMYSGVDGVMIGRGSFGKPWIFDSNKVNKLKKYINLIENKYSKSSGSFEIHEIFEIEEIKQIEEDLTENKLSFNEIANIAIKHAELAYKFKKQNGIIQMRKHLGWYFNNFNNAKKLREKLVRVNSLEEIIDIINNFKKENIEI